MTQFICQQDEYCKNCGADMPKGYRAYIDEQGYLICQDCGEESGESVEDYGIDFNSQE